MKKSVSNSRQTTRQRECEKINRKRGIRKRWNTVSRRLIILSIAACALIAAGGGWWFWHSGRLEEVADNAAKGFWRETADIGFKVGKGRVFIEGRHFTAPVDIAGALDVRPGDPILALSLPALRARLEAIPRVKNAEVARILPDTLHVRLIEREPVAVWQNEHKLQLIDQDGVVMEYVDPAEYKQLLLVVGEGAPSHTSELLAMLAETPELYKQVASAIRVGERRWNIRFKNGIELKLPEAKPAEAWQSFVHMAADQHLLERAIKSVDMRLSDRIFIRVAPEDAKPAKGDDSET